MTGGTGIDTLVSEEVVSEGILAGRGSTSGPDADAGQGLRPRSAPRLAIEPERAADDLVKLVLALVETLRQLMERQAIRRVESGALSDEEIERLGLTLLRLEERMAELKSRFGLDEEDLSLRLGSVPDLAGILHEGHSAHGFGDRG